MENQDGNFNNKMEQNASYSCSQNTKCLTNTNASDCDLKNRNNAVNGVHTSAEETKLLFVKSLYEIIEDVKNMDVVSWDDMFALIKAKLTEALIQNIYTKFDKDGDGEITMSEVSAVFNAFDADGNGDISEEEFIGSWKRAFGGSDDQALLVFGQIDKDGSKSITMDELSNLYKSMDVDGDGTITKKEFIGKWKELLR